MKKLIKGVLVAAVMALGVAGVAKADDGDRKCSAAGLRGWYVFAASGFNIVGGVAQPKAIVESIDFEGNGTLTVAAATASVNGTILHPPAGGSGIYTVAPDCTGTLTFFPSGFTFDLFVSPKSEDFFMIQTNPGTVLQGTVSKISR